MNWYQLSAKETLHRLDTSENGLSGAGILNRQQQFGLNKLVEAEKISPLKILLHQFTSPLIYILLAAGAVPCCSKSLWTRASFSRWFS